MNFYKYLTKAYRNYDDNIKLVMIDIALNEIDGMSEKEARNYLMNDAIPIDGSVSRLTLYSQTEQIAKEYYNEIIELVKEVYNDIPIEIIETLNNLTWFAWGYLILGNKENIDEIIKIAKKEKLIEKENKE